MKTFIHCIGGCLPILAAMFIAGPISAQELDRSSLPIKEPIRKTYSELDVRNATSPPRFEVKAPQGSPNVIIVLIEDMGYVVYESF